VEWRFSIVRVGGASDGLWRPELCASAGGDLGLIAMLEEVAMVSVYPGLGSFGGPEERSDATRNELASGKGRWYLHLEVERGRWGI